MLKDLKTSDDKASRKVNKLLKLSSWFQLSNIGLWIKANAGVVHELLCLAQDRMGLNKEQFLGICFAAIMAG